jgi:hypothetical protein
MAGPVSHIICALTVLNSGNIQIQDKQAFILGTSFPDIRYMGVISREQTHKKELSWQDVQHASSDFEAGMLLHALLDQVREAYVVEQGAYDHIPNTRFKAHCLKFFEDITMWYSIPPSDWQTIITYFDTIHTAEKQFGIPGEALLQWHSFIQEYLQAMPNLPSLSSFPFYACSTAIKDVIKRKAIQLTLKAGQPLINYVMGSLTTDRELHDIVHTFYDNVTYYLELPIVKMDDKVQLAY